MRTMRVCHAGGSPTVFPGPHDPTPVSGTRRGARTRLLAMHSLPAYYASRRRSINRAFTFLLGEEEREFTSCPPEGRDRAAAHAHPEQLSSRGCRPNRSPRPRVPDPVGDSARGRDPSRCLPTRPGAPACPPAPAKSSFWFAPRGRVSVAPRGVAGRRGRRPLPPEPGKADPAARRACSLASGQEAPARGAPCAASGSRAALPVPARPGGRTRVPASRPRAPPGLASAAAPRAGVPGCCAPPGVRGPRRRRRREEGPGRAEGCWERPGPRRSARRGGAPEPAARGARTALTPAAPRQAGARSSMVASERDEPPVLHRPQR